MAEYEFMIDGERLADHAQKASAALARAGAGLQRLTTATATAQHLRLLRAWIGDGPPLDERPTRRELKAWVRDALAELERVDALVRERGEEVGQLRVELAEERAAHDADVALLGDERDAARRECARACEEREELRRRLRAAHCERDRDRARHFECGHGVRVTVRPLRPGGVAENDVDV